MPFYDLTCPNNHERIDVFLKLNERPPCPECGQAVSPLWVSGRVKAPGVIRDEIPGGIYIKHGLCYPDGSPRRFDSQSEINRAAKEAGLTNVVRHTPEKGSDKSRITNRWV